MPSVATFKSISLLAGSRVTTHQYHFSEWKVSPTNCHIKKTQIYNINKIHDKTWFPCEIVLKTIGEMEWLSCCEWKFVEWNETCLPGSVDSSKCDGQHSITWIPQPRIDECSLSRIYTTKLSDVYTELSADRESIIS